MSTRKARSLIAALGAAGLQACVGAQVSPVPEGTTAPAADAGIALHPRVDAGSATPPAPDANLVGKPQEPGGAPAAGACALARPAFCDTFDAPHPGGRNGALDDRFWSVGTIIGNGCNGCPNGWPGLVVPLGPALSPPCNWQEDPALRAKYADGIQVSEEGNPELVPTHPGTDHMHCANAGGGYLQQAVRAQLDTLVTSMRILRPFDFTGRTGTIAFDSDAWMTDGTGHGTWPEYWVVEEPSATPYQGAANMKPYPRKGVGVEFHDGGCAGANAAKKWEARWNGPARVFITDGYRESLRTDWVEHRCFRTERGKMNHVELRLSRQQLEVWASDAGQPETLRRVGVINNLNAPLERGFVHLMGAQYNPGKDDCGGAPCPVPETRLYDNVGFDGPVLQPVATHNFAPAFCLDQSSRLPGDYAACTGGVGRKAVATGFYLGDQALTLAVDRVEPATATQSFLTMSVFGFTSGQTIRYRFNGKAWQERTHDALLPQSTGEWRVLTLDVPVSDLVPGLNRLELATAPAARTIAANLELSVN
jgi:hypothetical protein